MELIVYRKKQVNNGKRGGYMHYLFCKQNNSINVSKLYLKKYFPLAYVT